MADPPDRVESDSSATITISPSDVLHEDLILHHIAAAESGNGEQASPVTAWLGSLDAILVLGGGVPLSPEEPPFYVRRRCDVVARLFDHISKKQAKLEESARRPLPAVVCLSAGTAHLPQYINPVDGLPLWESTASAAYLLGHTAHPVPSEHVYAETTSYDTISNAFFARTTFTDVAGWRKVLVVTNEFHIRRSKAIFDWIFQAPLNDNDGRGGDGYEMYYLSCDNVGLTSDEVAIRGSHEAHGEYNVITNLSPRYSSVRGVWEFLTTKHDFYSAVKLVARSQGSLGEAGASDMLKSSYGGSQRKVSSLSGIRYEGDTGTITFSLSFGVFRTAGLLAMVLLTVLCAVKRFGIKKTILSRLVSRPRKKLRHP